jgi:hypothetical protein
MKTAGTKTAFMLLSRHTDQELSLFLQAEAEKGWRLTECKGNKFLFTYRPYDGRKVCAYSFSSHGPESSTESQLRHELVSLRRQGWDMLCIGPVEDIADSRRHAFLYEEIPGSPMPAAEAYEENRARKRGLRKKISNAMLCLSYIAAFILLLASDLVRIVSSNVYILFSLAFLAMACISLAHCILAFTRKGSRFLDSSTRLIFFSLVAFALLLAVDTLWLEDGSRGRQVQINGQTVRVYDDLSPITLESLGMKASGALRSTRYQSSSSLLASYEHIYDQSISATDPCYISITMFRASWAPLFSIAQSQLAGRISVMDEDLSARLGLEVSFSADMREAILQSGRAVCTFSSLDPITVEQLSIMAGYFLSRAFQ